MAGDGRGSADVLGRGLCSTGRTSCAGVTTTTSARPPTRSWASGNLRRDENDIVRDVDEYVQGTWDFAAMWSVMVGVRHSDVNFDSLDHYITATNGNDSGAVSYAATSPVAALKFKPFSWLHLYASYGQGFQTPLGSELAYRPDGRGGLNLGLQPARSDNSEVGAKFKMTPDIEAAAALFQTLTRNEIVVDTNTGGRSTHQNSGRTRRSGGSCRSTTASQRTGACRLPIRTWTRSTMMLI